MFGIGGIMMLMTLFFPVKNASGQTQILAQKIFGPFLQYGPPAPPVLVKGSELDTLARTIWGEGRGDGKIGMQAVACVIRNRVRQAPRFGSGFAGVCQKTRQFSCWNPLFGYSTGDKNIMENYRAMIAVNFKDQAFVDAVYIARDAIANRLPDITHGATHYHTEGLRVSWDDTATKTASIGSHEFYNNVA